MLGNSLSDNKMGHGLSSGALSSLVLTAFGIVFGDIGTSPLYAFQVIIGLLGGTPSRENILGLFSLIIWALLIIVSLKYVTFVMRADNDGEGGILALTTLLKKEGFSGPLIAFFGLCGATLIYGDGAITPAISVLSAVEGIKVISPAVAPFVLPLSVIILFSLFAVQYHGTARIGWVFGPIMMLWFIVLGVMGIWGITRYPAVLLAFNPWYGLKFIMTQGGEAFVVLGGVFLAVTGAEALYADMGHVGARPIRIAWYGLVLPALLLNYAGQAAMLMAGEPVGESIFYHLCPAFLVVPLIGLATLATVIASQAIITGAFSMTRQAIQLGWCPRLHITQTSAKGYGQIYIGSVNWMLMVGTLILTISFGSSDRLASAYGIAVSLTMLFNSLLIFVVMRKLWKWSLVNSSLMAGLFVLFDATFVSANLLKVFDGGWVPLLFAFVIYTFMKIWHDGAQELFKQSQSLAMPVEYFIGHVLSSAVARVPGTAIFMTHTVSDIPPIVVWHVLRSRALQERVVAITLSVQPVPWVRRAKRIKLQPLMPGFWRVTASYGFMEEPNITSLLRHIKEMGCDINLGDVTYYVGHETIIRSAHESGMPMWQLRLYAFMHRNAEQISEYLKLPRDVVVELGRQVEI